MLLSLMRQLIARTRGSGERAHAPAAADKAHESTDEGLRECEWLERAGELEAALDCYRRHAAAHPGRIEAQIGIANTLMSLWRVDECIDACAALSAAAPANSEIFSGLLFYSHFTAKPDARELLDRHLRYGERLTAAIAPMYRGRHRGTPDPDRRLRVGYVSRNFSRHSVGYFIEPVIEHHDRERFDVYCYYTHPLTDDTTERIKRSAGAWRHLPDVDPDALAACIHHDGVDVLVDLAGHTEFNRLPAFAREPAPLQLTWLAYPDTTGVRSIAYRITDEIADPPGPTDALHTEKLLRVAPPFVCYRPATDAPTISTRPENAPVVFGSFNFLPKLNEPLIALWCRVLSRVPGSRLVLKAGDLQHSITAERVAECFRAHGLAAERLDLRGWSPERSTHLAAYGDVDIALDTVPYNGTTTTCEALWMGVPVITLAGDVHMSRVGASLLSAAGLETLVARTPEDYIELAVALASDPPRRQRLRATMRERLQGSRLLDHAGFTRRLEGAYRDAWRALCLTDTRDTVTP
jgi:protein O-GlcNAc transferase